MKSKPIVRVHLVSNSVVKIDLLICYIFKIHVTYIAMTSLKFGDIIDLSVK